MCNGELTIVNQHTQNEIHVRGHDLNITMNIVAFTSVNLEENQLYTVIINASNINGSAVSYVSLSEYFFTSLCPVVT